MEKIHRTQFCLIASAAHDLMIPDYGAKYQESPSVHHGGMHKDGWTAGQTDGPMARWPVSIFRYSSIAEQGIVDIFNFMFITGLCVCVCTKRVM